MQRIGFYLTCGLVLLVPFGLLTRPNVWNVDTGGHLGRGITTAIAIAIIVISVVSGRLPQEIWRYPRFFALLLFAAMSAFAGLAAPTELVWGALTYSAVLVGYTLLALGVASLGFTRTQIVAILSILAIAGTVMCILSLIDYYGIMSIPTVNESGKNLVFHKGDYIRSLDGPFRSRTEFAAHASFVFAILLYTSLNGRILWVKRLPVIGCLGLVAMACFLSGSRALYLGIVALVAYLMFFSGFKKFVVHGVQIGIGAVVASVAFASWKPDAFRILVHRITMINPEAVQERAGDSLRLDAVSRTITELSSRPLGVGFTPVEIQGFFNLVSSHSIYTECLRAAGPIGIILLLIWLYPLLKRMARPIDRGIEVPIFAGLVCFGVYGAAHSSWQTNILWVLIGLAYYMIRVLPSKELLPEFLSSTPVADGNSGRVYRAPVVQRSDGEARAGS